MLEQLGQMNSCSSGDLRGFGASFFAGSKTSIFGLEERNGLSLKDSSILDSPSRSPRSFR